MKQYCRYCAWLVTGNGIYCSDKNRELSETYTKSPNHCKDFEFCRFCAYTGHSYTPRPFRTRRSDGQLSFKIGDNGDITY